MKPARLSRLIPIGILLLIGLIACKGLSDGTDSNIKDLDDNMIDLRMYHENLGDAIVARNQDVALWLETGLDSVLRVVADKFEEHRKLNKPFREAYQRDLKPPIDTLHEALEKQDWVTARSAYTMLTRQCNNCHRDREVDKTVQNWLERK